MPASPLTTSVPNLKTSGSVKKRWGAFTGTTLHDDLQEANVTQVFIVGVATSIGVESTARSAHELGYNVVLVADAMSDVDPETHSNSIDRVFPRLGEVTSHAEVLKSLKDR
jgi:nicotinamidase-related amidase